MVNPFENTNGDFLVLLNGEGQHSLWPSFAAVPRGWEVIAGPDDRGSCLAQVEERWKDIRPRSLVTSSP